MRPLFLLLTVASLIPAPAAAQRFVRVREPATGELAPGDSTLASGALYDTWHFRAEPGHAYAIYLFTDFEAQLAVGPGVAPTCAADCARGKEGGNGRFAAGLFFAPERQGLYPIRVGAIRGGQAGPYELVMEEMELPGADADTIPANPPTPAEVADAAAARAAQAAAASEDTIAAPETTDAIVSVGPGGDAMPAPDAAPAPAMPIRAGERVRGELVPADRQDPDYVSFDPWTYQARAGETVTLRMTADEYPSELRVGRWVGAVWEELARTPVDGNQAETELRFTFSRDGEYEIRARGSMGGYVLAVERP